MTDQLTLPTFPLHTEEEKIVNAILYLLREAPYVAAEEPDLGPLEDDPYFYLDEGGLWRDADDNIIEANPMDAASFISTYSFEVKHFLITPDYECVGAVLTSSHWGQPVTIDTNAGTVTCGPVTSAYTTASSIDLDSFIADLATHLW